MQTYAIMKNSGVAWLGDIPADWQLKRVGALFRQRNDKVSDKDYGPLSVTKNGIVPQLEDAAKSNDGDNRKLVLKGDFVINSRSDRKGSSGLSELDGSVSLINTVLADGKLYPRFAHHLMRSYPFQEEFYRWGQGIVADLWSTNYQRMKSIQLPVPDYETQKRIASHLDKETALIDDLIAKQQRLLELLEEKRRAIITRAVADDSWPREKVKYIATKRDHKIKAAKDVPYIGLEHVESFSSRRIEAEAQNEPEGLTLGYKAGDVLFGKLRPYLAKVLLATDSGVCSSEFIVLKATGKLLPEFLKYSLLNEQFIELINSSTYGAKMPRANWDFIGNTMLALPPLDKQKQIVDQIERQEQLTDQLKQRVLKQIDLLKERRTSLISSAVTGKVKI